MMKFYLENVIAAMWAGCWLPTWLEKEQKILNRHAERVCSTHTHTHTHTHKHTYTNTHMYTYTHMHIHNHTQHMHIVQYMHMCIYILTHHHFPNRFYVFFL